MSKKQVRKILDKLHLIPSYTEASLFLMGVSFLALFALNMAMREEILSLLQTNAKFIFIIVAGLGFSLYGIFLSWKTEQQKHWMLWFAIAINFIAAWSSGMYVLQNKGMNFFAIFPLINIASAILLLVVTRMKIVSVDAISNKRASIQEILIGVVFVGLIIAIGQYAFDLRWPFLFSISVEYATFFNKSIAGLFPAFLGKGKSVVDKVNVLVEDALSHNKKLLENRHYVPFVKTENEFQYFEEDTLEKSMRSAREYFKKICEDSSYAALVFPSIITEGGYGFFRNKEKEVQGVILKVWVRDKRKIFVFGHRYDLADTPEKIEYSGGVAYFGKESLA
ncbi:MAG: hypothetical protein HYV77_03570 [Candidatus Wildermuthbacteria bacterium]|nr:hypothetical protein [Candidatus Wildermuthbacteria bacterium]